MDIAREQAIAILDGLEVAADEGLLSIESFRVAQQLVQEFGLFNIIALNLQILIQREQELPGAFERYGARHYVAEEWCVCQKRKRISEPTCDACK